MRPSLIAYSLLGLLGCSGQRDRPSYYSAVYNAGTGGSPYQVTTLDCGPPASDAGLCGNEVLPTQQDRPNLYFVIDASGSMSNSLTLNGPIKYSMAVDAIVGVLKLIGHRVSYGASLFPTNAGDGTCGTHGIDAFKTRPGDSVTCSINGRMGDTLTKFQKFLGNWSPIGGTPLSATLAALKPTLTALPGKTAVIVATDGAPNCNPNASCTAELCEVNIDGNCSGGINCCDPKLFPEGPLDCVDGDATNYALADLLSAGIRTYVIGLPGIQAKLTAVLDSMAAAGGTARLIEPLYYEADDAQALAETLRSIATQVAVSCTITLDEVPPNWGQVNVYLDATEVPQSTGDGWRQIDERTLEITGSYCATLQTGNVFQVQVTAGCTTIVN
jgi:hypothetical protein